MSIVEQLASFSTDVRYENLPAPVAQEAKRLLLDSLGCALAAIDHPKGRIGIDYGRMLGGATTEATTIGSAQRTSVFGAAFANGELINALDMDAILAPGHVTPYVLPGALAYAESLARSGKELLAAIAASHEMSWRMSKAMDPLRVPTGSGLSAPPVYGFSSTIFGATAAIAMIQRQAKKTIADSLGIAGTVVPVQAMTAFHSHYPNTTVKYQFAGVLVQTAMTSANMAAMGHRGDLVVLDDAEHGFARMIGTQRWEPSRITDDLGTKWNFTSEQIYKPYPHCRVLHSSLDCIYKLVEEHDLKPDEIEAMTVYIESFATGPAWLTKDIHHVHDAQFSMAHGIAVGAHRVPPGRAWQTPETVFDPSVISLMNRVTTLPFPDDAKKLAEQGASRPARVEIKARGQTFVEEKRYPKGSPSPDPTTYMTTDELVAKFRHNAAEVLSPKAIDDAVAAVLDLESAKDVSVLMELMRPR
ncbi:MmgE/PrpD family protein [Ramlibacter sp.]|uniref:MmgE/PrpD family protein n=1 Tax=Ramlibacter sp. TaxID=1917967 RepID=UPI003D12C063